MVKTNEIIRDYGKTISPGAYNRALQGHQYIPQADQCIRNCIQKKVDYIFAQDSAQPLSARILDLGCGPGRLTFSLPQVADRIHIVGIDSSECFIGDAIRAQKSLGFGELTTKFIEQDFSEKKFIDTSSKGLGKFDIIFVQGVLHHLHDKEREQFLLNVMTVLKNDGIFIVGDEFIKPYNDEEERRFNVTRFYFHIIDEARKGGFEELAFEEAKNLIDDVMAGRPGAGCGNSQLFDAIEQMARLSNEAFYIGRQHGYENQNVSYIEETASKLAEDKTIQNFNRGDYKVSIPALLKEFEEQQYGLVLKEEYKIGPVDQLGGMGVLVFKKG